MAKASKRMRSKFTIETELAMVRKILPEYNFDKKYHGIIAVDDLWSQVVKDLVNASSDDEATKEKVYARLCAQLRELTRVVKDYREWEISELLHQFNLHRGVEKVLAWYQPKGKINAEINYFIAGKEAKNNRMSWNKQSNKVTFCTVDADHFSMIEDDEDVKQLATALTHAFAEL